MAPRREIPPRIVAIEGPSGVGKTTAAGRLARRTGWPLIREAVDRQTPRPSLMFRNRRELWAVERRLAGEDARRYQEAITRRDRGETVLVDTGFGGTLTYVWALRHFREYPDVVVPLRELLGRWAQRSRWGVPDLTVYLDAPAAMVRDRALGDADDHPPALQARHHRAATWERRLFLDRLPHVWPDRVAQVSATGSPSEVVTSLQGAIRRATPLPPAGLPEALRFLSGFRRPRGPPPGRPHLGNR
jgi:adenylate kinase family enzyme